MSLGQAKELVGLKFKIGKEGKECSLGSEAGRRRRSTAKPERLGDKGLSGYINGLIRKSGPKWAAQLTHRKLGRTESMGGIEGHCRVSLYFIGKATVVS